MPKKKKNAESKIEFCALIGEMIMRQVDKLWTLHGTRLMAMVEASSKLRLDVAWKSRIDLSEGPDAMVITAVGAVPEKLKDNTKDVVHNPAQPSLFAKKEDDGVTVSEPTTEAVEADTEEEEPKPKRGRKKTKKTA